MTSQPARTRSALDDLDVLRRGAADLPRARRPLLPRLLLGLLVAGGVAAAYGPLIEPLLFPPREVRLVPVRTLSGTGEAARRALATTAGWLEAEPFPTTVRPLVSGVVQRLEVLEGQTVKGGETVVAVLASPELENALRTAQAALAAQEAQVRLQEAKERRANDLLEQRIELRAALIAAQLEIERDRQSLVEAQAALATAQARRERALAEAEAQRTLQGSGGTPPISLRIAEAALREAEGDLRMREAAVGRAQVEVTQHEKAFRLAEEALAAPKALAGEAAVAAAEAAQARAERDRARVEMETAQRNVDLLRVRAPHDGVVLRLLATVGAPAGPMGEMREPATVGPGSTGALDVAGGALALLYDPARLQARVEVPLMDLGALASGTDVELEVELFPGRRFPGRVLRLLSEANIQNNKLWVKVGLLASDPLLKPEMLVRAKFLAAAGPTGSPAAAGAGRPRLAVPASALAGGGVLVLDPTRGGRARRVAVTPVGAPQDGWQEVEGDLGVSNEVVAEPAGIADGAKLKGVR